MKHGRKPIAVFLAAVCVLCCVACCLFAFCAEDPVHEHNYVAVTVVRPTCTDEGLIRYICSCGDVDASRDTPVAPTGHRWGPWTTVKEATTETEGLKERTCINDPTHKEYKTVEKKEPSKISQFFQNIIARFKALFDRFFSLLYRD